MNHRDTKSDHDAEFVRVDEAARRFSIGRESMRKLGREARAVVRIGGITLYSIEALREHLDSIAKARR